MQDTRTKLRLTATLSLRDSLLHGWRSELTLNIHKAESNCHWFCYAYMLKINSFVIDTYTEDGSTRMSYPEVHTTLIQPCSIYIPECACIFNRGAVLLIALLTLLDSPAARNMTSSPWQPLEGQAEMSTVVRQALPQLQTWWKSSINHRQIAAISTEYDHTMSHHARTVLQKYCTMTQHETNCKKIIYLVVQLLKRSDFDPCLSELYLCTACTIES